MKLHLPYFTEKTHITVGKEVVEGKAFQIIVWVSIAGKEYTTWDPSIPKLPAILDIGTTHNFVLTGDHLLRWAGLHMASLRAIGKIRIDRRKTWLRSAALWLHTDGDPFNLTVDDGIAVFDGDWPRLPILGLRALTNSKLQTIINGDTKQVIIRTRPKWFWPF